MIEWLVQRLQKSARSLPEKRKKQKAPLRTNESRQELGASAVARRTSCGGGFSARYPTTPIIETQSRRTFAATNLCRAAGDQDRTDSLSKECPSPQLPSPHSHGSYSLIWVGQKYEVTLSLPACLHSDRSLRNQSGGKSIVRIDASLLPWICQKADRWIFFSCNDKIRAVA